jgi:hypothetical protein
MRRVRSTTTVNEHKKGRPLEPHQADAPLVRLCRSVVRIRMYGLERMGQKVERSCWCSMRLWTRANGHGHEYT